MLVMMTDLAISSMHSMNTVHVHYEQYVLEQQPVVQRGAEIQTMDVDSWQTLEAY